MWIAHTDRVCLFQEVTPVEQALVQQIVSTFEEAYLTDIRNRTTNFINGTVVDVLTCLQDKYGLLIPNKILEREDIAKNMMYNHRDPIATVFSAVEELLEFSNITGMLYTQYQAVNISYVILHSMGNFVLAVREWNCVTKVQNKWVRFKQFFFTAYRELREKSNLTMEDASMHHAKMVRDLVAVLQEVLQQEQVLTENTTVI